MRTLSEYLNPNARITKKSEFPETPKTDDVMEFLNKKGFTEYHPAATDTETLYKILENRRFMIVNMQSYDAIYFCDEGVSDEKNPMFYLRTAKDGNVSNVISWICKICTYSKNLQFIDDYDEFLDIVNDHFIWDIK